MFLVVVVIRDRTFRVKVRKDGDWVHVLFARMCGLCLCELSGFQWFNLVRVSPSIFSFSPVRVSSL